MSAPESQPNADIKEVQMDVKVSAQEGGSTRRRRRARRSKTQKGGGAAEEQVVGESHVLVEKATVPASHHETPAPAPAAIKQSGGAKPTSTLKSNPSVAKQLAPIVVLAPAKKKAKIMLVPKKQIAAAAVPAKLVPPKTFKAKHVRVTIDNTARTQKRRRQVLRSVDSLTEEQLREQAVKFGLSRVDSVKKVPLDLLRKMLKDYYAMRKGFL